METLTYIRQEKSQLEFSYQNKTHFLFFYLSLLIILKAYNKPLPSLFGV